MSVQKVIVHANSVPWQQEYLPRFTAGFVAHGIRVIHKQEDTPDFTLSPSGRKLYIRNVHVIFANNSWKLTHTVCNKHDFPLLTVGRCFFGDRHDMVAIGWDGFNGAANFCLDKQMPEDRWQKHGHCLPGVRYGNPDGYVLVCGEFRECGKWYATMREILAGEDVRFRAHPFKAGQSVPGWKDAPPAGQDDIDSLFTDCKAVITYDSIAGCDAVLAGVPHVACGENSMARDVSFHSWSAFKEWEKTCDGYPFDVELWAERLAYCQWSHDEISNGEFWDHLKSRVVAT
jgi:hypothetical protein